jgi:hypothetical protein
MPAYNKLSPPPALYNGEQALLVNNAATDSGVTKTQQIALVQSIDTPNLMIINTTNQPAPIQVAVTDLDASYGALTVGGSALSVAAGVSQAVAVPFPLVRAQFAVAPTSGSLTIAL